jgi:hypothetical protein
MRWVTIIGLLICLQVQAQPKSTNGFWLPNRGTIRLFVVFAEAVGDPIDTLAQNPNWPKGQMPKDPGAFFDHHFVNEGRMQGYLTKYFHAASFGKYIVLGDYYPRLIKVPYKSMKARGIRNIVEQLDALPGTLVRTKHGYSTSGKDFDMWTLSKQSGEYKDNKPDDFIDCLVVIWRVNSQVQRVDNSGYISLSYFNQKIKTKRGFSSYSQFISSGANAFDILKHEYSHSLYGGNNFHNGGAGAGERTWLSSMSGWSNMNSWDHSLGTWNGWDRDRMGWKKPGKDYTISAVDEAGNELYGDLSIYQNPKGGVYILRDFVVSGDCIRIRLPQVNRPARAQYIWLENHRLNTEFDKNERMRPGVLAYLQVGKDDFSSYGDPGNYTTPIPASGRHDFIYHSGQGILEQVHGRENPIAGNHYLMRQAVDMNNDGQIYNELFNASKMIIYGERYQHYPCFGNPTDAFRADGNPGMSIDANPAPTPVLTYSSNTRGRTVPQNNRTIHLNGLNITVLNDNWDGRGAVQVKITWDDWAVENDVRWCGPLILQNDKQDPLKRTAHVSVSPGKTLTIDQSWTPVKYKGVNQNNGQYLFADRTYLKVQDGATLELGKKATLDIRNHSTVGIYVRSSLILHHKSKIRFDSKRQFNFLGGKLIIKKKGKTLEVDPKKVPEDYWQKIKWGKMKRLKT